MQSFVPIRLHIFFYDGKGYHGSRGWKEKLDLELFYKRSYKSERTDVFEVFEQSNESDSHLEVIGDDYNLEINESSDSEEDSSEFRSRSKGKQNENLQCCRKIK